MAENSGISWCDHSFNGWIGCTKVSPGCDFCYAETVSNVYGLAEWGPGAPRKRTSAKYWKQPYKWDVRAEKNGRPELVFCSSMADIADGEVPDEWRDELIHLAGTTPNLRWLFLTKRPQALLNYLKRRIAANGGHNTFIPPNIWWGFTAEDQQRFDERVPVMNEVRTLATRPEYAAKGEAPVLWVSAEPLIGPIKMGLWAPEIDWVIPGGESGGINKVRRMAPEWALDLVNEAHEAGNKAFVKQMGELLAFELGLKQRKGDDPSEWPEEFRVQEWPDDAGDRKAA